MTGREMQSRFELLATSQYGAVVEKPQSREIEMWLNDGLETYFKTRYSGINFKGLSYEQDQKRTEDLRNLKVKIHSMPIQRADNIDSEAFIFGKPDNYFITTGESVTILPLTDEAKKCWRNYTTDEDGNKIYLPYRAQVTECNDDNIDSKLSNKLSDYRFQGSFTKPLRVFHKDSVVIYSDKNYEVQTYTLTYLKTPKKIDIHTNPSEVYTDFPKHALEEIVKLAVQLFLENKEKQRFNTFSHVVNTME